MTALGTVAPEIAAFLNKERQRQSREISLVASENYASRAVLEAQGSLLTNVYADADPGLAVNDRCEYAYEIERLAVQWARELFGADYVNVQVHSGTQANAAVYMATLSPEDVVLAFSIDHGGHSSYGDSLSYCGRYFKNIFYGVDPDTEVLDYEEVLRIARACRPKLIIAGASGYPRVIHFDAFRSIADEVGARLLADVAHVAGLIAAGLHPSPVPYADFVTFTTHKTMGGARGGVLMCRGEHRCAVERAVVPGLQAGPLMHQVAAKAVTFREAQTVEFRHYQRRVLSNAKTLAAEFLNLGYRLATGGTDNHLIVLDLNATLSASSAASALYRAGIMVNEWPIPGKGSNAGLRIGTPAVTRRGMEENEMRILARLVHETLQCAGDRSVELRVKQKVAELAQVHEPYSTLSEKERVQ